MVKKQNTIYDFKKDVKERLAKKEINLIGNNKKEYKFQIDCVFSELKMQKLFKELIALIKICEEKNEKAHAEVIYEYLVFKYFTNIFKSIDEDLYESAKAGLDTIIALQELELYEQLLCSFDVSEVKRLNEKLNYTLLNMKALLEEYTKQNEDVLLNGDSKSGDK